MYMYNVNNRFNEIIIKNFIFLILCLNIIIAVIIPILPPMKLVISKDNSLILFFLYMASILSADIKLKEIMFIIIK